MYTFQIYLRKSFRVIKEFIFLDGEEGAALIVYLGFYDFFWHFLVADKRIQNFDYIFFHYLV